MGLKLGIDIGSTTVKVVIMDGDAILWRRYERHFSQVPQKTAELLEAARQVVGDQPLHAAVSGSAGFGVAKLIGMQFIQEVFATGQAIRYFGIDADAVIELGGEDAKILFLTGGVEERMNGSCAGGTGAFIDQMATLLNVTTDELDELSLQHTRIYPIASRCGVFAKTDIQPLLNQGARKEDLAASIFQAVVNQTITGLAQGRPIEGKVVFLGGPLYFLKGLRERFQETLKLDADHAFFPEWSQYAVAIGTAVYADENAPETTLSQVMERIKSASEESHSGRYLEPLFQNRGEYEEFSRRHSSATVEERDLSSYEGSAYLGIDCGSTTTKLVLIGQEAEILYQYYSSNQGNPVELVRRQLTEVRRLCGDRVAIRGVVTTGYGEELIQNAFHADAGIVETVAHFRAARFFDPQVDFILDIGGQDIKCFKVRSNAIDSIMLNEACSSGCGSFIETFAKSMGYSTEEFAQKGLFAKYPVDLGSRCTVFMNSSVKQAQKDGATVEDISAGLSISVVKNAVYKVIRATSASELGHNVVVQGGPFYNDAVLRAFERELGANVTRPVIAGLMGAYGAALSAREINLSQSSLLSLQELEDFTHTAKPAVCGLCPNRCNLTVNSFAGGGKYISGNRCERPLGSRPKESAPNLYQFKLKRLVDLSAQGKPGPRGKIGLALGMNIYENLPFWHTFFTQLGFEVVVSPPSTVELFAKGRYTIPSDTVCYPAKLMHGHMEYLLEQGVPTIFYPSLTYNFDEKRGDNHYNCPVVAYYPELLHANLQKLSQVRYLYPYLSTDDPKSFVREIYTYLRQYVADLTKREVKQAAEQAYQVYYRWHDDLRLEAEKAIAETRARGGKIIVLAGRPYHVDPEVNHGIDRLISGLGVTVLTEDSIFELAAPQRVRVLNQWTYHARMYSAAQYVATQPDMELVQLVSFGCGIDAITTDEVRDILESAGKLYTELKIDEINNLGAVKIRIRSLLEAMEERRRAREKGEN